jgi:hypothetical protein
MPLQIQASHVNSLHLMIIAALHLWKEFEVCHCRFKQFIFEYFIMIVALELIATKTHDMLHQRLK